MIETILGIFAIIANCLLVVLYIRTKKYDGTLMVTQNEEGSVITLNVDPSDLIVKDQVRLKVIGERTENNV